jgi:protein-disulfide isomerase
MMPVQPPRLAVPIGHHDHLLGSPSAAATIVWYGDYWCPHCRHAWLAMKSMTAVARTAVRVAFRHFPTSLNGDEITAALAAEAAGAQGRFWEMHDLLFANTGRLGETDLTHLALRAGVEIYRFAADFAAERYAPKIRRDLDSGVRSGVVRTPTFFLDGMMVSDRIPPDALAARAVGPQPTAQQHATCNGVPQRLGQ